MKIFGYIVLIIVIVIGITFSILNSTSVVVNYYVGQSSVALSLLLVIAFAIGGIIGLVVGGIVILKQKARIMSLHKKLRKAQNQLAQVPLD